MSKVLDLENALPAIKTWIWSHFQSLKGGTAIAKNTDLNTIMTVGNYYCSANVDAQTLLNTPITASSMQAFTMKVGYSNGTAYPYQELILHNTGDRYYRYNTTTNDTSKWMAWQAFDKADHLSPKGYSKKRRTTANIPSDNSAGVETFLVTASMTEGKPLGGDGHILHFNWDNNGRWASQLAIHNDVGTIETRYQGLNSGVDWTEWRKAAMFGPGVTPESGKALVTDGNNGRIKTIDRVYDPVTIAEVRAAGGGLTTTDSHYAYLNALLKAICIKRPNLSNTIFYGSIQPNSFMNYEVHICNTSDVDSNGLPGYSFGIAYKWHTASEYGVPMHFCTSGHTFIFYREGFSALYGKCNTAAGTAEKVVTCSDFNQLFTGTVVNVKMTNANTATNPTLNVNGTGAKPIMRYGTTAAGNNENTSWYAGAIVSFVYDGTNWLMLDFAHRGNADTYTSAYCPTAAATAAKAATCTNYALLTNSYLHVTMVNANTYNGAITLNVNGKGAKPIWINGAVSSSSNKTLPAGTYLVFYDGSKYMFRTDGKIDGVTAAAGTNDKTLATTAFVKKACDDAIDGAVGGHMVYPVGTIIHTNSNAAPSDVGVWEKTWSFDDFGSDDPRYLVGFGFSWYKSSDAEGLVAMFNIPGLKESGNDVSNIEIGLDVTSDAKVFRAFYNGKKYNLPTEGAYDTATWEFVVNSIAGDTLTVSMGHNHITTGNAGTGTPLPNNVSGSGYCKGIYFHCSKKLYYWQRVS